MQRGFTAEIDLNALSHNLSIVKKLCGKSKIIAVVKADAYGHGAVEVSKALVSEGIQTLAVAFTSEAIELRESGLKVKIISLFDPDVSDVFNYGITPVISTFSQASSLSKEALKRNMQIPVHIKIDTGMGRTGFPYDAVDDIEKIFNMQGLLVEGVMSHLSDSDSEDKSFAMIQIERFKRIRNLLQDEMVSVRQWHIANSAAILTIKDSIFDAVRPGIMLYGYCTVNNNYHLKPLMTIKTTILQIRRVKKDTPISYNRTYYTNRDSLIAVIPAGYADSINRLFSNNLEVLVGGIKVPVVGKICMDLTMIDVTEVPSVNLGDEVVILGSQANNTIDAMELCRRIDTIPYEILTSFGIRARRTYKYSTK